MNHPYNKFIHLQLFMMVLTVVVGILAIINGLVSLIVIAFYFLSLSFLFEGIAERKKGNTLQFAQQLTRSLVIVIFISYLYFILT
ncbi:hypothetical protein [Sediminibacillus massiliensis]|uniref:hypothetical protein n=1 Tax=Sediminibacillus massiliensis TaxID=1926277 RepID=UPI0009888BBB|nr:hypothetical protein [Sediminibacillus massiliensis]